MRLQGLKARAEHEIGSKPYFSFDGRKGIHPFQKKKYTLFALIAGNVQLLSQVTKLSLKKC